MKYLVQLFVCSAVVSSVACSEASSNSHLAANSAVADTTPVKTKIDVSKIKLASAKDTTCHMPLSAGIEDTVNLNGKVYGFCSKECKDEFVSKLAAEKKKR